MLYTVLCGAIGRFARSSAAGPGQTTHASHIYYFMPTNGII